MELTLKEDKTEVQRYQDIMLEKSSEANLQDMDPAEIIHHLSKLSYDAIQEAQPDKTHMSGFRSPYKDGWSPEAMVHMAHLRALFEIRRHINGFQKRRKWKANGTQCSADTKRIVKKWKHAVMDKEKEIQIQLFIEGQIVCVRNLLHGKLRSDLKATAKREKAVQEGKLTKTIKSITGQNQFFYNAD